MKRKTDIYTRYSDRHYVVKTQPNDVLPKTQAPKLISLYDDKQKILCSEQRMVELKILLKMSAMWALFND